MRVHTVSTVRVDPDRLLLASLEDLGHSEGFGAFVKRLMLMRDRYVGELVSQSDPTEMYRTQGRIDALNSALQVQKILYEEVSGKVKRKP